MSPDIATMADLPNELLLDIVSYLSFSSLVRIKNVNRRCRDIVSETKLQPVTRKLFDAYNCIATIPSLERGPYSVPTPTQEHKAQYIRAVSTVVGRHRGEDPDQDHEALSVFLLWVNEWPSHAAVRGFCPAAVIAAYLDGSSHTYSHGGLAETSIREILSLSRSGPNTPMLKRIPLQVTQDQNVRCVPREPTALSWSLHWDCFIPLHPLLDASATCKGRVTHFAVLVVPSGDSWSQEDAYCTMATIDSEGYYKTEHIDLAEFLVKQAEVAAIDILRKQANSVRLASLALEQQDDLRATTKAGGALPTSSVRGSRIAPDTDLSPTLSTSSAFTGQSQ